MQDAAHLLPPGWELTGPQGLDLGGAGAAFPAAFSARDAGLERFLDAAKCAWLIGCFLHPCVVALRRRR
jgi:hypothetical protein